ncbi:MAG TPA: hypothetical protein VNT25_03900 [Allosphingosinicella sp.]|nr:hypothetical protein [Allosphingosinicella sp.]
MPRPRQGLARPSPGPYLGVMALPRPSSPSALWADIRNFARQRSRHQVIAGTLAVLMPIIIVIGFYYDAQTNIMPGEQIVYVENWPANRTDAEIKAQQKIDQERREKALAERQRQFKEVERKLGL